MANPSPFVIAQDGSGPFLPTSPTGLDVTPGNVVTLRLASYAGVGSWSVVLLGLDELSDPPVITFAPGPTAEYSFTFPNATGRSVGLLSIVNGGNDVNGVAQPGYTTSLGLFTLTSLGVRALFTGQTFESDPAGWIADLNALIRVGAGTATFGTDVNSIDPTNQKVVGIRQTTVAAGVPADGASLVKLAASGYGTAQLVPNLAVAYGVVADGATDDRAALALADTAATSTGAITLSKGAIKVASNLTLSSRVLFKKPARLVPANGVVVTFKNGVEAGDDHYCLDVSLGGSFVFQDSARFRGSHTYRPTEEVHASWFGAKYDPTNTTTSDAAAFQAACNSLPEGGTVVLANGTLTLGTVTYTSPIVIGPGLGKAANITVRGSGATYIAANNGFNSLVARSPNYYPLAQYTLVGGAVVRGLLFGGALSGPVLRLTDLNDLSSTLSGASKFSFRQKWIPKANSKFPVNASFGTLRYNGGTAQTGTNSTAFYQTGSATTCVFTWGDDLFVTHSATVTVTDGGWIAGHEYEITAEFDGTLATGATLFCTVFDATAGKCATARATTAGVTHTIGESFYNEFIVGGIASSSPFSGGPIEQSGSGAIVSIQYVTGTNNNVTPTSTAAQVATATNATPIVITTTVASGLSTGDWVTITGGTTNTGVNGTYQVTVSGSNVTLVGSVGNGAYDANSATVIQAFRPVVGQYTASTTSWTGSTRSFMCNFGSGYCPPAGMCFVPPPSAPALVATATSANPAVVATASGSGYATGDTVVITGATGNTAINGTWLITASGANLTLVGCDASAAGAYNANSATLVDTNVYYATIDVHVKKSNTPFVAMLLRPWGGFSGYPGGSTFTFKNVQLVQTDLLVICEGGAVIDRVSTAGANIWMDGCLSFEVTRSSVNAPPKALGGFYVTGSNGKFSNCGPLASGGAINLAFNDSSVIVENCYWQPTTAFTKYSVLCLATGDTSSYRFHDCTIDGEFYSVVPLAGFLISGGTQHFDYSGIDSILLAPCPFFRFSIQPGTACNDFLIRGSFKPIFGAPIIEIDKQNNPPMSSVVRAEITTAVGFSGPMSLTNDVRYVRTTTGEQSPYYWVPAAASTNDLLLGAASNVIVSPYGGASDVTLTGVVSPPLNANHTAPVNRVTLTNRNGAFNVLLSHRSGSSSAFNRIRTPDGATFTLTPGKSCELRRSESGAEWLGAKVLTLGATRMGYSSAGVQLGVFVATVAGTTGSKSLAVSWTSADGSITSTAHGCHNGDLISMPSPLPAGPYIMTVVDVDHFTLVGAVASSAGSGTGLVIRTTASTAGVVPAWDTTTEGVSTTTDNTVTWTFMGSPEWNVITGGVGSGGDSTEAVRTTSGTLDGTKNQNPVDSVGGVFTLTIPVASALGERHLVSDWGGAIETNAVTVTTGTSVKIENPVTGDRTSASFTFGTAGGFRNGSCFELQWNGTLWVRLR